MNALLGSCPNNTEVYLTPLISTQNHTVAGLKVIILSKQMIDYTLLPKVGNWIFFHGTLHTYPFLEIQVLGISWYL